jgi:amidase
MHQSVTQQYESAFALYDALVLPTTPFTAPRLFDREKATTWETVSSTFGQTLNTMQFNLTGHPAMSLPIGLAPAMGGTDDIVKLPVSMQLVAKLHGERHLLEIGYAFEQAYDWRCEREG